MPPVLLDSRPLLKPFIRAFEGKVRDGYDLGGGRLLIVATDRISAFDVVLPQGVPDKGAVLTQLSAFWFNRTADVVPNHLIRVLDGTEEDPGFPMSAELVGRSMIVHKASRVDIECVARGYISGSGWKDYQYDDGVVCGIPLPKGLQESDKLPEPIFTPATKAVSGHDENISFERMAGMVGLETATHLRDLTLSVYSSAAEYALERGIIIADTKLEFGQLEDGSIILIDELLTPDSSRFWPLDGYKAGRSQPSFDKQPVRDWLILSGWNREPPPPNLPEKVVKETAERYRIIHKWLVGKELAA